MQEALIRIIKEMQVILINVEEKLKEADEQHQSRN